MNIGKFIPITLFAAALSMAGAAQAQFGDIHFPVLTFVDVDDDHVTKSKAKAKCKQACKLSVSE